MTCHQSLLLHNLYNNLIIIYLFIRKLLVLGFALVTVQSVKRHKINTRFPPVQSVPRDFYTELGYRIKQDQLAHGVCLDYSPYIDKTKLETGLRFTFITNNPL